MAEETFSGFLDSRLVPSTSSGSRAVARNDKVKRAWKAWTALIGHEDMGNSCPITCHVPMRYICSLLLLPRSKQSAHHNKLSQVVSVVIGDHGQLAKNSLTVTVRNRRKQAV